MPEVFIKKITLEGIQYGLWDEDAHSKIEALTTIVNELQEKIADDHLNLIPGPSLRESALVAVETTPLVNGQIYWVYE